MVSTAPISFVLLVGSRKAGCEQAAVAAIVMTTCGDVVKSVICAGCATSG